MYNNIEGIKGSWACNKKTFDMNFICEMKAGETRTNLGHPAKSLGALMSVNCHYSTLQSKARPNACKSARGVPR